MDSYRPSRRYGRHEAVVTSSPASSPGSASFLPFLFDAAMAAIIAAVCMVGCILVVDWLHFEPPTTLPRAVASSAIAVVCALVAWLTLSRRSPRWVRYVTGLVGPSIASALLLSFLLYSTPNYLNGLGGDQSQRLAYFTKFTSTTDLVDPFYQGIAPFYPAAWFWVGGQIGHALSVEGWVMYKPFAIFTMALSASLAFVLWRRIVSTPLAVGIAMVTAIVGVHLGAYEPYSWIFIALLPAVAWAAQRVSSPAVLLGVTVFVGLSCVTYTLAAMWAVLIVVVNAWVGRRSTAGFAVTVAVGAVGSTAIGLLFWGPYVMSVVRGVPREGSVATHYAPEIATTWPTPMLEWSGTGILCLVGFLWLVARLSGIPRSDSWKAVPRSVVVALTGCIAVGYAWFAVSGFIALSGTTLLPFRIEPLIVVSCSIAGVCSVSDGWNYLRFVIRTSQINQGEIIRGRTATKALVLNGTTLRACVVAFAAVIALSMTQNYTKEHLEMADFARGTGGPPRELLDAIDTVTNGATDTDVTVLAGGTTTAQILGYKNYWAFQAPGPAYAAPEARYQTRNDAIGSWASATTPSELRNAMAADSFPDPNVFVFEITSASQPETGAGNRKPHDQRAQDQEANEQWVFTRVDNTMPSSALTVSTPIVFSPYAFDDPSFAHVRVGSLMVIGVPQSG